MKYIREITKNGPRAFAVCECVADEKPLDGTDADDEEGGQEGGETVAFPGVAGVGYSDLFFWVLDNFFFGLEGGVSFWGGRTAGMMGQQNTVQMRMNRVSVLSQAFQAARTAPAGVAAIFFSLLFQACIFGGFDFFFGDDCSTSLEGVEVFKKRPREALRGGGGVKSRLESCRYLRRKMRIQSSPV